METSGLWPMLHWERQGISQVLATQCRVAYYCW